MFPWKEDILCPKYLSWWLSLSFRKTIWKISCVWSKHISVDWVDQREYKLFRCVMTIFSITIQIASIQSPKKSSLSPSWLQRLNHWCPWLCSLTQIPFESSSLAYFSLWISSFSRLQSSSFLIILQQTVILKRSVLLSLTNVVSCGFILRFSMSCIICFRISILKHSSSATWSFEKWRQFSFANDLVYD